MFLRMTSSALAICLVTAPAAFSLTPDEVWNGWVTYYNSMGYKLAEGSREQAGEVLTVKDVVLTQDNPSSKVKLQLGQVVLTGTGDGNVRSTMAETIPVHVEVTEDDKPVTIDLTLKMPGAEILSSGGVDDRTDHMTAKTATITVDKIDMTAEQHSMTDVASFTATDLVADTVTRGGQGYSGTSTIGKLDYTLNVVAKNDEGTFKGAGWVEKLALKADVTLPANGTVANIEENLGKALKAGLKISGNLTAGASDGTFDYTSKAEDGATSTGQMSGKGTAGKLAFAMAADAIGYQGETTGGNVSITDSQLPAPITYTLDRGAFDLQIPVAKSDTPAPFKLTYAMNGLALGDAVWNLADPDKKLPRTPANIELDLSGLARVTADLLDPEAMKAGTQAAPASSDAATLAPATPDAAVPNGATPAPATPDAAAPTPDAAAPTPDAAAPTPDAAAPTPDAAAPTPDAAAPTPDAAAPTPDAAAPTPDAAAPAGTNAAADDAEVPDVPSPFQPVELTINKLAIDAVGAKISAEGALKGANGGTLETPVGTLHARMEGVNKLIDTLVAMGVVPEQQVQGYRMMLALFTKTTEGSDVMTSDIEFREDGAILANGQQIK